MIRYKFSLVNQDSLAIFSFVQLLGGELVAAESALTESKIGFIDMLIDIPMQKNLLISKNSCVLWVLMKNCFVVKLGSASKRKPALICGLLFLLNHGGVSRP